MRVAFICLGCKLNFSETSTWAREFVSAGHERVDEKAEADLYVINTCSVTAHADKKCRQAIRQLKRRAPEAKIVVTGCYAQLQPGEALGIEGVDLVVGAEQKPQLYALVSLMMAPPILPAEALSVAPKTRSFGCRPEQIESFFSAYSSGDRTRSFLKVQDGCNYHCSYCTVPLARGKSRNIPIQDLVKQAQILANEGVKEVVLTGVNTGDFGRSTGESFLDLLKALAAVSGIRRWRISSIEPNLLTEEILAWIAQTPSFMPHFHIPLQSGSDRILAKMGRRYTRALFAQRIGQIRHYLPQAFIGVDVIVGFPGEDAEAFAETCHLLETLVPSFLHVFPYSKRPNTPAAGFPQQVAEVLKRERVNLLTQLSDRLYAAFCAAHWGRAEEVLFEAAERGGMMSGFSRNYIKVHRPYEKSKIGEIISVILSEK
jgi:MiaB-like tRNA modifying enzyme